MGFGADDWQTGEQAIDEEHQRFFDMTRRLIGVVKVGSDPHIIREAVDVLRERMAAHGLAEETYAAKLDGEAAAILRDSHKELLDRLGRVRDRVGLIPVAELLTEVEAVGAAIDQHEVEVDVPLFRLMAKTPSLRPAGKSPAPSPPRARRAF